MYEDTVQIRIEKELLEMLKGRAKVLGVTLSEYIRGMSVLEFKLDYLNNRMLKMRSGRRFDEDEYMGIVDGLSSTINVLNSIYLRYSSIHDKLFEDINYLKKDENKMKALMVVSSMPNVKVDFKKEERYLQELVEENE